MEILKFLEVCLNHLVEIAILIFEYIGVSIIIVSGIRGCYNYIRRSPKQN